MELLFIKAPTGLSPACEEATEWLGKKKLGSSILVEPREMRNGPFFKKWWALVKVGYDYWSETVEPLEYKGRRVLPSFDRFRKDVTIWAGYYEPVVNIKGELRIEAVSLKWASMTEETFTNLYDATIRVLLAKVFNGEVCKRWSEDELRRVSGQIMEFAA